MKMKRIVCLFLIAFMLLSSVACAQSTEDPTGTLNGDASAEVTEGETGDPNFTCDLPANLNYGDEIIGILYANVGGRRDELISEYGMGVVSDAVYERNILVEEQLGVQLEMYPADGDVQLNVEFNNDITSGLGEYDIISNGTFKAIIPAMEGRYINLSELDHINTDKHYWTQGYNDMVTFTDSGMQFLASGSMSISMFRYTFFTIYNKDLFVDYQLPDLYETVKQGEWTLDYQYSIVKDHYVDKDGDSKASTGDFYGFVTGNIVSVDPYMVASDTHMIIKDPDTGELTYNSDALAKLVDLCDKVQLIYNDESTYVYDGGVDDGLGSATLINHFADKNALMATTTFISMENNFERLVALSYGIAPMPKFSSIQKNYYSYVQDQVSSFGISTVVSDEARQEMCAAVLEAMAYHSYRLVRPAYYETVLSERYMQDPQSNEVLDLIFDSLYFDFSSTCSDIFPNCEIRNNLRPLLSGDRNTIAASTKSWKRTVERKLGEYNDILEGLVP